MTTDPALAALRRTRAQQQAVRRWLRLAGPLLICYWAWICWHAQPGPGLSGRGLAISVAFAGFVVSAFGVRAMQAASGRNVFGKIRLRGPSGAFLLVLLVSSGVLVWAQPGGAGTVGLIACALLIGRQLPGQFGLPLALAAFVVLAVNAVLGSHGAGAWALVGVVAFCGFYAMTYLANRLGEANEQAERLLIELENTRAAEAKAAALAERQRLAREIHDVLAPPAGEDGCAGPGPGRELRVPARPGGTGVTARAHDDPLSSRRPSRPVSPAAGDGGEAGSATGQAIRAGSRGRAAGRPAPAGTRPRATARSRSSPGPPAPRSPGSGGAFPVP